MQWPNVMSPNLAVVIRGLYLILRPLAIEQNSDEVPSSLSESITESTAEAAQSFLHDEATNGIGVGSDQTPDSLVLQKLLESMLAGLNAEVTRLSIALQRADHSREVLLTFQTLSYRPDDSCTLVESSEFEVRLRTMQNPDSHATDGSFPIDAIRYEQSRTSRSTSSSSVEASELIQSTIFDRDQYRSIYMSALASSSMYQSAVDENPAEVEGSHKSHNEDEVALILVPGGLRAMLRSESKGMTIDISCQAIEGSMRSTDLVALVSCLSPYAAFDTKRQAQARGSGNSVYLSIRCTDIRINLCLCDKNIPIHEQALSPLKLNLTRITFVPTAKGSSLKIHGGSLRIGDMDVLHTIDTELADLLHVSFLSSGSTEIATSTLRIQIMAWSMVRTIGALEQLVDDLLRLSHIEKSPKGSENKRAIGQVSLACPSFTLDYLTDFGPVCLILQTVEIISRPMVGKSRSSIQFTGFQVMVADQPIIEAATPEASIIDFTTVHGKQAKRTLEFINYETLFETSERDFRKEHDTLQAVKRKAKECAVQVIRASISPLWSRLTSDKIRLCSQVLAMFQTDRSSSVELLEPSSSQFTRTFLAEIRAHTIELDTGNSSIEIACYGVSLFGVQNLKGIDSFSVEMRSLGAKVASGISGVINLVSTGLHRSTSDGPKPLPVFVFKGRRNNEGPRTRNVRTRLALADLQFDYCTDIAWLKDVFQLCDSLKASQKNAPYEESVSSLVTVKFAVDLCNVCIGLNPYISSARGLLYFRRSLIEVEIPAHGTLGAFETHAGVLDLFLIDDVEGGPNESALPNKDKKDPLTVSLSNLGFVKVGSAETVEVIITLSATQDGHGPYCLIEVAGAIVTLSTCADSTATLTNLVTMLRLPVAISDELKYKFENGTAGDVSLDIFGDVDDDAFSSSQTRSLSATDESGYLQSDPTPASMSDTRYRRTSAKTGEAVIVADKALHTVEMRNTHFVTSEADKAQGKLAHSSQEQYTRRIACRLTTRNCFIVWNLHDGYDWERTRQRITLAVIDALAKAKEAQDDDWERNSANENESQATSDSNEVGDLLFNSIYIALPAGATSEDMSRSINKELAQGRASDDASQSTATYTRTPKEATDGNPDNLRLGRSKAHKVRFEVSGMSVLCDLFDAADQGDLLFEANVSVRDIEIFDNLSTSTWRKFLTYHRAIGIRQEESNMLVVEFCNVRPVTGLMAAELAIKVNVLPLRLHVDQDTLDFITRFFDFRDDQTLISLTPTEESFIQRLEVQTIQVQIDYKPKRVDYRSLRSGRTTEFKNFFILEDSNMVLKHVVLYGVCGFTRAFQHLNDIWLNDIKSEQLGTVLAGVAPLRSLASFSGSLKNLVMVPMNEYHKDGRIVPGLKKGLSSFARSTGSEAVRLGAKLAVGTQGLLESAETLINNAGEASRPANRQSAVSMYADQPRDLRQGVSQAMTGMTRNILTARDTLVSLPKSIEEQTDARGAVQVAVRSGSVAVLRPFIGGTEMIAKTLMGLRNTMNPEQKRLNDDKYK